MAESSKMNRESAELIPGPSGPLSVRFQPGSGTGASALAVICHPHPLMGGTMDNKVVTTLVRAYRDLGLSTVRFNFRGVGESAGIHDQGVGEVEDVLAVVAWAQAKLPHQRLTLAGFSFGSAMAARAWAQGTFMAARDELLLVAPPVTRYPLPPPQAADAIRVIYGDADEVIAPQAMADWVASGQVQSCQVLPGTSHFFHGQLVALADWVRAGWLGARG